MRTSRALVLLKYGGDIHDYRFGDGRGVGAGETLTRECEGGLLGDGRAGPSARAGVRDAPAVAVGACHATARNVFDFPVELRGVVARDELRTGVQVTVVENPAAGGEQKECGGRVETRRAAG